MVHAGDARTLARKSIHIIMSQPNYTYIEPLKLIDYSPKCIAIVGDTKQVKDELKALGGRYNPALRCGPGWLFSSKRRAELEAFVRSHGGGARIKQFLLF